MIIVKFLIGFKFTIIFNLEHCVPGLVVAEKIRKMKVPSVDWV